MNTKEINKLIDEISALNTSSMTEKDFFLSWEQSDDEISAVLKTAEALMKIRQEGISSRIFDSGLAVSIFRDNSTRTRFSFASAVNLLGLTAQDLDEKKSQIAHGETVRETACMISFLTEAIGIRDDIYIGEGNKYMREVAAALDEDYAAGILPSRPAMVNLQCDLDHPTQAMSDALHLIKHYGGVDNLKGKKLVMSWAYSPSYGKPLSVPQGVIALMSRMGMDVTLAHPEGYNLIPETEEAAAKFCTGNGASFKKTTDMNEAFEDADIVYPKSWAPFSVMQQRTELLKAGDSKGLEQLEKDCLKQNEDFIDWECNEELMQKTKKGNALYMHCLPADITDVSCARGEVSKSVFDRYRKETYIEASYKPYIIAAMIMLRKKNNAAEVLKNILAKGSRRILF